MSVETGWSGKAVQLITPYIADTCRNYWCSVLEFVLKRIKSPNLSENSRLSFYSSELNIAEISRYLPIEESLAGWKRGGK
jgi:hypothetical protein